MCQAEQLLIGHAFNLKGLRMRLPMPLEEDPACLHPCLIKLLDYLDPVLNIDFSPIHKAFRDGEAKDEL